ncbi:6,7-dimethyl-8-ribityllumazine synthase, partial [Buchnera aphidicola]|nr:6,7-dimethyl-8-ribityllumazine synthase [Buchnera aphidicola]
LKRVGKIHEEKILKIYVPGAYEIPIIASYIAKSKKYDAIIAIGTIIKGQTQHFKNIAHDTTSNLAKISIKNLIPITLGLLITD